MTRSRSTGWASYLARRAARSAVAASQSERTLRSLLPRRSPSHRVWCGREYRERRTKVEASGLVRLRALERARGSDRLVHVSRGAERLALSVARVCERTEPQVGNRDWQRRQRCAPAPLGHGRVFVSTLWRLVQRSAIDAHATPFYRQQRQCYSTARAWALSHTAAGVPSADSRVASAAHTMTVQSRPRIVVCGDAIVDEIFHVPWRVAR